MAAEQYAMQSITQAAIVTAKAAIMAVKEAENAVNVARSVQVMPRIGSPALKQLTFERKPANTKNWKFHIKNT